MFKGSVGGKKAGQMEWTSEIRITFLQFRDVFYKVFMLKYFNLKKFIRVETDVSGFAIIDVLL